VDDFYAARTTNMAALPWSNFAPPFSVLQFAVNQNPLFYLLLRNYVLFQHQFYPQAKR
jgi:hypothetical protein